MKYILLISIAFLFASCGFSDAIIEQLLGNNNQAACEEGYTPVSDPAFIGFHVTLDAVPDEYFFEYKNDTIDIYDFLNQYGATTIYFNGVHIAGFINGINNVGSILETEDIQALQDGNDAALSFGSQRMYVRGALNESQFINEIISKPSVRWISFSAMDITCAGVQQIIDFWFEDCKETPDYIDARNIVECLTQEQIDELELRGSTVRVN